MKTDDNGYRLIVRACGDNMTNRGISRQDPKTREWVEVETDPELYRRQVYEKLGLDPNEKPTLKKIECPFTRGYLYPPGEERVITDEERMMPDLKFQRAMYWTFDDFPELEKWHVENTAGLDLLGEAVRKPVFRIPYTRENENTSIFEACLFLSEVQMMRVWARALQARANYRLGIGDIDGATYDIVTIHHLGRHVGKQGMLVSWLVGIAFEGMAYATGIGSNPEFPPTKEQLERLVAELDALPPRRTLIEAIESERLFGLAALQDIYWGNSNNLLYDTPFGEMLPRIIWTLDINIAMARQNKVYDVLTGKSKTIDGREFDDNMRETSSISLPPLPLLFVRSRTHTIMDALSTLFIPAMQAEREASRRMECVENMQRLTLALLLYEKEHGSLPDGDWRAALMKTGVPAQWFQCPSCHGLAEDETTYAMIGNVPNAVSSPNQILLAEVLQPQKFGEGDGRLPFEKAVFWQRGFARPLELRPKDFDGFGSAHPRCTNLGFRSGAMRAVSDTIDPDVLRTLLDGSATELP